MGESARRWVTLSAGAEQQLEPRDSGESRRLDTSTLPAGSSCTLLPEHFPTKTVSVIVLYLTRVRNLLLLRAATAVGGTNFRFPACLRPRWPGRARRTGALRTSGADDESRRTPGAVSLPPQEPARVQVESKLTLRVPRTQSDVPPPDLQQDLQQRITPLAQSGRSFSRDMMLKLRLASALPDTVTPHSPPP